MWGRNFNMNDIIKDRLNAHLQTIESSYDLKIVNKIEVAEWIADKIHDEKTALTIATVLNTWVLTNNCGGKVKIPFNVLKQIHDNLLRK
jgi:uncharacterized protein (DUF608 family)